ncbi:hypothetical protein NHX12_014792 [Muraenolepis orangiensis]|uniref:Uncharacterized protein n=1 Tax=Muraenolepis orangiensis TaxID=630683 RepID=A0A9Q0DAS5_9TELE|nr:hypothetical protein NHX12_014792 [Muraenolepis orangiensis]
MASSETSPPSLRQGVRIAPHDSSVSVEEALLAAGEQVAAQKHLDVIFLQETHTTSADDTDWGLWWEGPQVLSHGSNFSAGVAVLFRSAANATILSSDEVVKGRLLIVRAEIDSTVVCLINIYAPNQGNERVRLFHLLRNTLTRSQE